MPCVRVLPNERDDAELIHRVGHEEHSLAYGRTLCGQRYTMTKRLGLNVPDLLYIEHTSAMHTCVVCAVRSYR